VDPSALWVISILLRLLERCKGVLEPRLIRKICRHVLNLAPRPRRIHSMRQSVAIWTLGWSASNGSSDVKWTAQANLRWRISGHRKLRVVNVTDFGLHSTLLAFEKSECGLNKLLRRSDAVEKEKEHTRMCITEIKTIADIVKTSIETSLPLGTFHCNNQWGCRRIWSRAYGSGSGTW